MLHLAAAILLLSHGLRGKRRGGKGQLPVHPTSLPKNGFLFLNFLAGMVQACAVYAQN